MSINPSQYLALITSEHNQKPKFVAMNTVFAQHAADLQNLYLSFSDLFDVDQAVGDQQDKIGQWVGVSRNLKQTLDVPSVIDSFARANGPLGASWTVLTGSFAIVSDTVQATTAGFCTAAYTGSVPPTDHFAELQITEFGDPMGPAVRLTAGNNFYYVSYAGGNLNLYKVVAGAATLLGSVSYAPLPGDVLKLDANGSLLTAFINDALQLTITDTTFAGGTYGIASDLASSTSSGANWKGGSEPGISVLDDIHYRTLLKLFIAMNSWDGTVPGIYTIWNSVFAAEGYQILVQDNQDMSMLVVLLNPPTDVVVLAIFTQGYFLLRPAGVLMVGFFQPSVTAPIFGFDAENANVAGFDVGSWMIPIVI